MANTSEEVADILSADIAGLIENPDGTHDVLLIRRGGKTEHGKLALPGGKKNRADLGHVRATARREFHEETGILIGIEDAHRFRFFHVLDGDGRDPRGDNRTSIVFLIDLLPHEAAQAKAGDDASEIVRVPLRHATDFEMAFDHATAIRLLQTEYGS